MALGISRELSKQDGSMGIDQKSSIRNEWLQKGRKFPEPDFEVQKLTGLEFWFTPYLREPPPVFPLKAPPRQKMTLVTIPGISIPSLDFSSSNSGINTNTINSLCNKTCYQYYDNSSVNDLYINVPSNESISLGYSILSKNIDLNAANYFIH